MRDMVRISLIEASVHLHYIYIYIYLRVYIICIKINLCTNHVFSLFGTCYSFPSRGLQRR